MPPLQVAEGKTVPEMFQSRVQLSGDEVALRYKKLGIWHPLEGIRSQGEKSFHGASRPGAEGPGMCLHHREKFPRVGLHPVPSWLRLAYALAHFSTFRKLKERLGFDRVRLAFSGAAPISPDVLCFFQAIGIPLREGYGMTEGTGGYLRQSGRPG